MHSPDGKQLHLVRSGAGAGGTNRRGLIPNTIAPLESVCRRLSLEAGMARSGELFLEPSLLNCLSNS
jgi:hypothetical protein